MYLGSVTATLWMDEVNGTWPEFEIDVDLKPYQVIGLIEFLRVYYTNYLNHVMDVEREAQDDDPDASDEPNWD
jgi:hypothetical protein